MTRGRVENSVAYGNRYGIVASGGDSVTIVNCTIVGNESLGLSLPSGSRTVAFNNLIATYVPWMELKLEIQRGDKLATVPLKLGKPEKKK